MQTQTKTHDNRMFKDRLHDVYTKHHIATEKELEELIAQTFE